MKIVTITTSHFSYIIISDCLTHDAVAIHLFSSKYIEKRGAFPHKYPVLQERLPHLTPGIAGQNHQLKSLWCHPELV